MALELSTTFDADAIVNGKLKSQVKKNGQAILLGKFLLNPRFVDWYNSKYHLICIKYVQTGVGVAVLSMAQVENCMLLAQIFALSIPQFDFVLILHHLFQSKNIVWLLSR